MAATEGPVLLGVAESYAVLAGAGITNTGPTTITGDTGSFPTTSVTGFESVTQTGTNYEGADPTPAAKDSLVVAFNDAAGRTPTPLSNVELGGLTLTDGTYSSGTFGLTGTLTLDAQGNTDAQFIFQTESTLITAVDSRVELINGADACRVVWKIGSSATFDTRTAFAGDVLAAESITANNEATFRGRLLALDGAVTLDENTITAAGCVAPQGSGTTTTTTTGGDAVPPTASGTGSGTATATGTGTSTATGTGTGTGSAQPGLPATGAPLGVPAGAGASLVVLGTLLLVGQRRALTSRGRHFSRSA